MRVLSWNVRGLGKDRMFREAKNVLQRYKPQIVFFCETKLELKRMRRISESLNFENCFEVGREGMGGGLALLWSSEVTVHIQSYSKHHIDSVVYAENGSYWRCTGVYGHPVAGQKYHTWTLLKRLTSFSSLPWLCFGDFNEILLPNEKKGGNNREIKLMYEFREAIRECDLRDMGWKGMPFTWSNKRYEAGLIEERLDRFLCNKSWGSLFHENAAETVVTWTSDHNPILMDFEEKGRKIRYERRSTRRIHYEDFWSSYDQCKQIVKREWSDQRR